MCRAEYGLAVASRRFRDGRALRASITSMRGSGRRRTSWTLARLSRNVSRLLGLCAPTEEALLSYCVFGWSQRLRRSPADWCGAAPRPEAVTMNRYRVQRSASVACLIDSAKRARDFRESLVNDHEALRRYADRDPASRPHLGTAWNAACEVPRVVWTWSSASSACGTGDGARAWSCCSRPRGGTSDCRLSRCSHAPAGLPAVPERSFGHLDPALYVQRRLGRGDRIEGVVLALGSSHWLGHGPVTSSTGIAAESARCLRDA